MDQRDIREVQAADVQGARQAHFFAGIAGWPLALALAGWPDDIPVWTGSCPCQPFSQTGRRRGFADPRHLWPEWFRLIRECQPPVIFGEQVANGDGYRWFDVVSSDLEEAGYAIGAASLSAAGVGAPHIRQRLYFVAVALCQRLQGRSVGEQGKPQTAGGLFHAGSSENVGAGGLEHAHGSSCRQGNQDQDGGHPGSHEESRARFSHPGGAGFWADCEWLPCLDGRLRPVEPGTFPLAHGIPNRVGRLRAYGNAIVPEVAAAFIRPIIEYMCAGFRRAAGADAK